METLKKGSRGEAVKVLQRKLNLIADGIFGKLTEEAVKTFQREHRLTPDGIVGEKTWTAINGEFCDAAIAKATSRRIDDIAVHCTASREGKELTAAQIRAMHKAQGWSDIGYHYIVRLDGTIEAGRDVNLIGAHVKNYNAHSIGVSYVGGLDANGKAKDTRTEAQRKSLVDLLTQLKRLYPKAKIKGHRDYSPDLDGDGIIEPEEWLKACPCFDATKEYASL